MTEFCKFLQVLWHFYQVTTIFTLEVTNYRKRSHFRRGFGYRSPA